MLGIRECVCNVLSSPILFVVQYTLPLEGSEKEMIMYNAVLFSALPLTMMKMKMMMMLKTLLMYVMYVQEIETDCEI